MRWMEGRWQGQTKIGTERKRRREMSEDKSKKTIVED